MASINNVVITFRLETPVRGGPFGEKYLYSKKAFEIIDLLGTNPNYKLSTYKNFSTARNRHSSIAFIVFHSGCVNITGIPNLDQIRNAILLFNMATDSAIDSKSVRVANIVASGRLPLKHGERLDLKEFFKSITNRGCGETVSFTPHLFSGMYYRRPNKPTVHIFAHGKYNITGAKSLNDITNTDEVIKNLFLKPA